MESKGLGIEGLEEAVLPYLCGHVQHHGNHRGVVVAVDDEAHLSQFPAEVSGVLRQLPQPVSA